MKKLLIIEDNELNLDLMIQLLEEDYTLCYARSGFEGINMALSENPDLILMDITMIQMDGFESMCRIKRIPNLARIPILAVSARAMTEDIDRALQAGFDDYLTKPIDEDMLFTKLDFFLKR